ncbi:hypothetical protein J2799_001617 [Chryseobacterium vietnamense]|uniref:hypothetical protein n=1 Tax=Chryseobacterium vietnamense TaxID=866785 RepID=UPI0028610783|nr:hypothetical protein [Chryseobacterium vietnamense]MDR6487132.1 hypothetical protein [Chryseobacterium vietnamense]
MKNIIIILISTLLVSSCTVNTPQKNISYKQAKKYFVKNAYDNKDLTEKIITSQDEFERVFGAATTMGINGKPTPIDFSKENVLALIYPKTSLEVKIIPISLQENEQNIVYSYKVIEGPQHSFTTIPNTIIIIQKSDLKKIVFHKIKE